MYFKTKEVRMMHILMVYAIVAKQKGQPISSTETTSVPEQTLGA